MKVPLLDLKAQYEPIKKEISELLLSIADSQNFIGGPDVRDCELALASYCRSKYAIGCSSGSDALVLSLLAIDIKPGDEVITTPFTFFATAGSVAILGAVPRFVDVLDDTFNIDPRGIEKVISKDTKAIIAVDLFGQTADLESIRTIADKNKIKFIEDSAQSIGAEYKGKRVGEVSDITTISFYPAKNIGAFGDAGAVLTNDEALREKITMLREHGSSDRYFHKVVGINARLDTIQAAVILTKLKKLDGWTKMRQMNAQSYYSLFKEKNLEDFVILPKVADYTTKHTYNQFVIKVKDRDKLKEYLAKRDIATAVFYPLGLHMQECFSHLGYREGDFPAVERLCKEVLALPIYPELSGDQLQYVVECVAEFYLS